MRIDIKQVIITSVLVCSMLFLSLPIAFAVEGEEKEPGTDNVNVGNDAVAEPPSGPNIKKDTDIEEVDIETPASVTGKKFEGTGTVEDFSTTNSKAFFTITDKESNVFYLIIDLDKTANNVYFLSDVNKSSLEGSVEPKETVSPVPVVTPTDNVEKPAESGNNTFLILVFLVAGVVVAVYYFRVIKKKKEQGSTNDDEDDVEDEMMDEDMLYEEKNKDEK